MPQPLSPWASRLRALLFRSLSRLFDIAVSKVSCSHNTGNYPLAPGYQNRMIFEPEYTAALIDREGLNAPDPSVFTRGDQCVATFHGEQLVGYNFFSRFPTAVDERAEFFFDERFVYSYAAYTHSEHRGKGLSPSRWRHFSRWQHANDQLSPSIFYIDLTNVSSLRSGDEGDRLRLGYAGWIGAFGRRWYWSSPLCHRFGAGFRIE